MRPFQRSKSRYKSHRSTYHFFVPTSPLSCNLLIAFQTRFGTPALSSLAIHTIVIVVCFRSSAANSIFSGSPSPSVFKNRRRSLSSKKRLLPPLSAHHMINCTRLFATSVALPSQNPLRIQKYVDMWDFSEPFLRGSNVGQGALKCRSFVL